jgi:hypothetical protein
MTRVSVDPATHRRVLDRDGRCFLLRLDLAHECRDRWGTPHSPYDKSRLTVDHVVMPTERVPYGSGGMKGKRPPHDERHLVAMCWAGNVGVPSAEVRDAERAYLADV